jgi:signal transduction histidine kinase
MKKTLQEKLKFSTVVLSALFFLLTTSTVVSIAIFTRRAHDIFLSIGAPQVSLEKLLILQKEVIIIIALISLAILIVVWLFLRWSKRVQHELDLHIAQIKKHKRAVEKSLIRQKEIDKMKTEFVSVASHQMRTPLSAIRWYGEMLLGGDAGKMNVEQKEFVGQMHDSSIRMIKLVNSLLNVSRIESGRIIVDPVLSDLGDIIDGVLDEMYPRVQEKNQKIIFSKCSKLPKISVDPRLVREVYVNLLSNAIKYSSKKSLISIDITMSKSSIISKIEDNGYGIPKKQQKDIFERFFRADNVINKNQDGTGLGLYITKSILEASGGKIWFESEEGKGTTFWFSLPRKGVKKKSGDRTLAPTELIEMKKGLSKNKRK